MADAIELTFTGDWRINVTSRDAAWAQRVIVSGAAGGMQVLGGNPGATLDVFGNGQAPWTLRVEHNDGDHGWQPNWITAAYAVTGARYTCYVGCEDDTGADSDRDYNDLSLRLDKLGMVSQPVPPFALSPGTLQATPEGVFEATLGRYFMAVRVRNIWTLPWPPSARVGLSDRCRAWLAAAGVDVIDGWSAADQEALGQAVVGGRVAVGALPPWEGRLIYFKVDVGAAAVRKHIVELQVVVDDGAEDIALVSRDARAPMCVTRTTYDPVHAAFVSRCDEGVLTASIKRMVIDLNTFRRAVDVARRMAAGGGGTSGSGSGSGGSAGLGGAGHHGGCDPRALEQARAQLRAFLDGKDVDLCAVWRAVSCCCAGGAGGRRGADGRGDDGGGTWTGVSDRGIGFFVWPSDIDYAVEYLHPFAGQYGPIPFQDPWWKVLLVIIAIILTIAAAVSGGADLVNRSDERVIGTLTRAVLNPLASQPVTTPLPTDPGSVDAAVVTLNGHRGLTGPIFSVLDAAAGEANTTPVLSPGIQIATPGTVLTNAQIAAIFQNLADNPGDPAAQDAVRAFKSGARTGTNTALLSGLVPIKFRTRDDGTTVFFVNQIKFVADETGAAPSCHGDSGSLWFQKGTNAVIGLNHSSDQGTYALASRIEDVMSALSIRFA